MDNEGRDEWKKIPGWFEEPAANELDSLIRRHDIKTVIEIGAFMGRSSNFFASRVEKVYSIDPFKIWDEGRANGDAMKLTNDGKDFFEAFRANNKAYIDSKKIVPLRTDSRTAHSLFPELYADLIYIDGAHDLVSVATDISLWSERAHRVICGDDYSEAWPEVKTAVDLLLARPSTPEGTVLWYVEKYGA